ncbi:MAG: hypothetical protein EOO28_13185 [Comamonadaceae bacterium]|nr:MAG: hypothetical protein EOO28_13185 [Comamonadaceae bacterium]
MTSIHIAHLALMEAADQLRLAFKARCVNGEAWSLNGGAGAAFDVEVSSSGSGLMFQADVATVADAARVQVYEMLLQYNALWTQTGGARMALGSLPGPVVMMLELPASEVTAPRIGEVLTNMTRSLDAWRAMILACGAGIGELPEVEAACA